MILNAVVAEVSECNKTVNKVRMRPTDSFLWLLKPLYLEVPLRWSSSNMLYMIAKETECQYDESKMIHGLYVSHTTVDSWAACSATVGQQSADNQGFYDFIIYSSTTLFTAAHGFFYLDPAF